MESGAGMPALRVTAEEGKGGGLGEGRLGEAQRLFRVNGCLLVEDVIPATRIAELRAAFAARYGSYFVDRDHPDALTVGGSRFMITVKVEPPFSDPLLYANPFALPLIKSVLGPDCVLGSFGAVAALPGAPDQHKHRDTSRLFGYPLDDLLPCYAVTLIIPLVELNGINGTTRMWKGSHVASKDAAESLPHQDPVAAPGSCLLMDYRLLHAGTANRSPDVRPILYIAYYRPWYRDYKNFYKQQALLISSAEYEKLDASHRPLFATAQVV